MPDMHVWPPIRMDWRKMTKTRDSILRMNQTIVYVGFNAVEYNHDCDFFSSPPPLVLGQSGQVSLDGGPSAHLRTKQRVWKRRLTELSSTLPLQ